MREKGYCSGAKAIGDLFVRMRINENLGTVPDTERRPFLGTSLHEEKNYYRQKEKLGKKAQYQFCQRESGTFGTAKHSRKSRGFAT